MALWPRFLTSMLGALALSPMRGLAQSVEVDPVALVRRAVDHRIADAKTHPPLRYELRRKDDRRDSTKEIVETKDGDVARLIAEDGKPLPEDTGKAELARLDDLEQHPELQEKRKRSEEKDAERVTHLLSLLPDALDYNFAGMTACGMGECYRLTFAPKPSWNPPDLESNLLRGVAGEVWIDKTQEQLVRLDANFIEDVNFGLGILGRLNKGSTARLEQTDVGPELGGGHDWELTRLTLNVTGKALLVKTLSFKVTEETTHFAKVPEGIGYKDAIRMLKAGVEGRR